MQRQPTACLLQGVVLRLAPLATVLVTFAALAALVTLSGRLNFLRTARLAVTGANGDA